jgi:epoxide hydrolase 4
LVNETPYSKNSLYITIAHVLPLGNIEACGLLTFIPIIGMSSQQPTQAFQFQHLLCGDIRLFVAEIGSGPPVIFLHGFPEHWQAFAPMMMRLAPSFRCIAPDQRGYGKSDRPLDSKAYTIDQLADDIALLIERMGLQLAHIVAHDWGGLVAWHFASRHPNLLDRLAIFNAPHPFCLQAALDNDPAQRLASAYAHQFSQPQSNEALDARGPDALWAAFFGRDEAAGWISLADKASILENWAQPDGWHTMLNWYRAAGFDYSGSAQTKRAKPATINAPTLLVWGQNDPLFVPTALKGHSDFITDFRLEMMAEGGHSVFRQYPDHCAALVSAFLSK